jgi:hypothetical protein
MKTTARVKSASLRNNDDFESLFAHLPVKQVICFERGAFADRDPYVFCYETIRFDTEGTYPLLERKCRR